MPKARKKMFSDSMFTKFSYVFDLGLFIHFSCICLPPKNERIGTK